MQSKLRFEEITEKMTLPDFQIKTDSKLSAMWAAASGDFDPIHYDHDYAKEHKLPNIIVNGRLKIALLANWLNSLIGPDGRLKRLSVRHQGMDIVGNDVTIKGVIVSKSNDPVDKSVECEIWMEDHKGNKTATGSATLSL